ncbi:hypothetical protein A8990_14520 [Paenibacillus taihuensis]|uniref:TniQ protein n=1 Tax=Paenibacillus taihuensis TaxID=1156355 RepID=A0A3D9R0P4_9BACL|nr:hypothetical protein A8990_14520 [Paenibacillus taihuensis]
MLRLFGSVEVKKIRGTTIGDSRRELFRLSGFDPVSLEQNLYVDIIRQNEIAITKLLMPIGYYNDHEETWFPKSLRWCRQCMSVGYHSWLHQFSLIKRCPIHMTELITQCPTCNKSIPFLISDTSLGNPFTCKCGNKLADFAGSQWSTWKYTFQITDECVKDWIERGDKKWGINDRLLFNPNSAEISTFYRECRFTSQVHQHKTSRQNSDIQLTKELYEENKQCFKSIDKYIRNKLLCKHHNCIRVLQELRKLKKGEFPPICPYAYAYIFWRQSILNAQHFYITSKKDHQFPASKSGSRNFVTQLIEETLVDLRDRLSAQINLEVSDTPGLTRMVLNRYTIEFCLNYFHQWLSIAKESAAAIRVPSWTEINKMMELSQPMIVFRHSYEIRFIQEVEVAMSHETNQRIFNKDMKCISSTKRFRKEYRQMRTFTPMGMAMKVYENPSTENKQLSEYVNRYVSRLRI